MGKLSGKPVTPLYVKSSMLEPNLPVRIWKFSFASPMSFVAWQVYMPESRSAEMLDTVRMCFRPMWPIRILFDGSASLVSRVPSRYQNTAGLKLTRIIFFKNGPFSASFFIFFLSIQLTVNNSSIQI